MDNYQKMLLDARKLFLKWDPEKIAARLRLRLDESYVYVSFLAQLYRISRATGVVESMAGGICEADFSQSLSIYDYVCRDNPVFVPSGRFTPVNGLRSAAKSSPNDTQLHRKWAEKFQDHLPALKKAVGEIGISPFPQGDAACMFPVFDGFNAIFQFWEGDEEFPPSVRFLWDENTPDCLKYETVYYVMGCFLSRIQGIISDIERNC